MQYWELLVLPAAGFMAGPDPVACWGAAELMRNRFELPITVITGPATDNEVGQHYIHSSLGLPAHNARRDAAGLLKVVRRAIDEWVESQESGDRSPQATRILEPSTL